MRDLSPTPALDDDIATKKYVDDLAGGGGGTVVDGMVAPTDTGPSGTATEVGAAPPHRYWRVLVTATGNGNFGFSEIEMAETPSGANRCGAGTPSAPGDDGVNHIAGGFDGNSATVYGAPGGLPRWIDYDFGLGNAFDVQEIRVASRTDGYYTQNITAGKLQYSDNGVDFTDQFTLAGTTATANGQVKTFTNPDDGTVQVEYYPTKIAALNDVDLTDLVDGNVLVWDETAGKFLPGAGGGSGGSPWFVSATGTGASQAITLPVTGLAPEAVMVFGNGIKYLVTDYTITGTTLTVTSNTAGDSIEIVPVGAG